MFTSPVSGSTGLTEVVNFTSVDREAGSLTPLADNITTVGAFALENVVVLGNLDNCAFGYQSGQLVGNTCLNSCFFGSGAGKLNEAQDVIMIGKDCCQDVI